MNDAVDVASNADASDAPPCIVRVAAALQELGDSIAECRGEGIEPADAFRAVGVPVPSFASAMLNNAFPQNEDAAEAAAPSSS